MVDVELIRDLSNAFGPSGFEEEVCRVVKQYAEGFDVDNDAMYNLYMKSKDFTGTKPVIMLDAHLDECGFIVQSILENGLLSIITLGGFHMTNLPAHSVIIRNSAGEKIRGIITSKPVHFMTQKGYEDCSLEIETIYVDVGSSSRKETEEEYGIHIGDPMMPEAEFSYDEKHRICFGKAFDNRVGCACIIDTMKALLGERLNVDVVGAFASQEEVGILGSYVTSQIVKPDLAIVFEGSPADDFYYREGIAQGSLKKGVQIRRMDKRYISNVEFINLAKEIGDRHGIKYQEAVRRGGSTNAARISIQNKAVPVLVLGVPSRYVHTHYNFCAMEDIEATVKMALEVIKSLDQKTIDRLCRRDLLV